MNILITSRNDQNFKPTLDVIVNLINNNGHKYLNWDDYPSDKKESGAEILENFHYQADIIIACLNMEAFGVFVEIGFATALKKPIIVICTLKDLSNLNLISPELFSNNFIIYDQERIEETLINPLKNILNVSNVEQFIAKSKKNEKLNVFVSYSHNDTEFLNRLKVHIKPLERDGFINFWSDTDIQTGSNWKLTIENELEKAKIAILLISADFLASDFIINNELPTLLKNAEEKGLTILPVILKPCRFERFDKLSKYQSINPANLPLSKISESDREEYYVKITDFIDKMTTSN